MKENQQPIFFKGPFYANQKDSRLTMYGDTKWVRESYLKKASNNLTVLLQNRYEWMIDYLPKDGKGVELGCGAGFSEFFLKDQKVWRSDCFHQNWLSHVSDATNMPYQSNSLDFIITADIIHHLPYPLFFFQEAARVLKPGAKLIIKDAYPSLLLRSVLRLMNHEGYDYGVDVFDTNSPSNLSPDPWSGNNAIVKLFLNQRDRLEANLGFETIKLDISEAFMIYLSGGVSGRVPVPNLPKPFLKAFTYFDDLLAKSLPNLFASSIKWVLVLK